MSERAGKCEWYSWSSTLFKVLLSVLVGDAFIDMHKNPVPPPHQTAGWPPVTANSPITKISRPESGSDFNKRHHPCHHRC